MRLRTCEMVLPVKVREATVTEPEGGIQWAGCHPARWNVRRTTRAAPVGDCRDGLTSQCCDGHGG